MLVEEEDINAIGDEKNFRSRLSMKVAINKVEVIGLIDGGTEGMVISSKLAEQCGIKVYPKKIEVMSAFLQKTRVKGLCFLQHVFDGKVKVTRVYVAEQTTCPLLIGSDFFVDNNLIFDYALKRISCRKGKGISQLDTNQVVFEFKSLEVEPKQVNWPKGGQGEGAGARPGCAPKTVSGTPLKKQPIPMPRKRRPVSKGTDVGQESKSKTKNEQILEVDTQEKSIPVVAFVDVEEELNGKMEICLAEVYPGKGQDIPVVRKRYSVEKYFDINDKDSFIRALPPIGDHVSEAQKAMIYDAFWERRKAFSQDDFDVGKTEAFEQAIRTVDDFVEKFKKTGTRLYKKEDKEFMTEWVKFMKGRGLITDSKSRVSCAAHVVRYEEKPWRLTVDFRPLNQLLICEDFPYVSIQEAFENFYGKKWFTTFDYTMAFYAIILKIADRWKTAFRTHDGLYEFTRLPMGLSSSPKAMQMLTNMVVGGKEYATGYVDDVVVHDTEFDQHLKHVKEVLKTMEELGLKVKPKKCQLFCQKIKFLGYEVSEKGIAIPEERVRAIKEMPLPNSKKQVKSFLGVVGFNRQFIPDIERFTGPLNDLTTDEAVFEWTDTHTEVVNNLKDIITKAPILRFPSDNCQKVLYTDASNRGIGGCFAQLEEGIPRPIAYFSKTLSKPERKWSTIEKELYAIVHALRKYGKELADNYFEIYTDHKPLLVLNRLKDIRNARLNRWGIELSAFRFKVKHINGVDNEIADGLSRLLKAKEIEKESPEEAIARDSYELAQELDIDVDDEDKEVLATEIDVERALIDGDSQHIEHVLSDVDIRDEQNEDRFCQLLKQKLLSKHKKWRHLRSRYLLLDQTLYRKKRKSAKNDRRLQVVVPVKLIPQLIDVFHKSPHEGGHRGVIKCEQDIIDRYWFENYREHIRTHIKLCGVCNRVKVCNQLPYGVPQVIPAAEQPFDHIGIDVIGPFIRSETGKRFILTVVDRATRYVYAKAIPNHTKETVIRVLRKMFEKFATPKRLTSDRATEFMSVDFQQFLKGMGIEHHPTCSYYASSNGLSEVSNRKLVQIIKAYVHNRSNSWCKYVGLSAKVINRSVNKTTNYSPFYLLFGYNPGNAFERKFKLNAVEQTNTGEDDGDPHLNDEGVVEKARAEARARIEAADRKWAEFRKHRLRTPPFKLKDMVWIVDRTQDPGIPSKLTPIKCGPWIIVREPIEGSYQVHPLVKMRGRYRKDKMVNSRMCFPYFGKTPRNYAELCERIDEKEFESDHQISEDQIWDVEDMTRWHEMLEESDRQHRSLRTTRGQSSQQSVQSSQYPTLEDHDRPVSDFTSERGQPIEDTQQGNSESDSVPQEPTITELFDELVNVSQESDDQYESVRQDSNIEPIVQTQVTIAESTDSQNDYQKLMSHKNRLISEIREVYDTSDSDCDFEGFKSDSTLKTHVFEGRDRETESQLIANQSLKTNVSQTRSQPHDSQRLTSHQNSQNTEQSVCLLGVTPERQHRNRTMPKRYSDFVLTKKQN